MSLCGCRCQTYEGGIGGEPGAEAHGGYVSVNLRVGQLEYFFPVTGLVRPIISTTLCAILIIKLNCRFHHQVLIISLCMASLRYTFCGLAALALINKVDVINLPNLVVSFSVADNDL